MTEKMKNFTVSEPQLKIDNLKKNFETDIEPIDYSKSFSDDSQKTWIKAAFFQVLQPFKSKTTEDSKVGSFVTILSIWNTMIGSSSVAIPYCVSKAGIIPTIILAIIFMFVCFYTCRVVVKTGGKDSDYANTVYRYFGKTLGPIGRIIQIIFNLSINLGGTFIYFVIINQNLYPCVAVFLNKVFHFNLNPDSLDCLFGQFSVIYCGVLISCLIFPLLIMKNIGLLMKLNSYGIYLVSILLVFVYGVGVYSLINTKFEFNYYKNTETSETRYIYLFGDKISTLAGTFSLGFFSHSFVLPLMKNNKNQENNKRDLFLGYIFVMITYLSVGILGYIGFSGKSFSPEFFDNWFRFFPSDNIPIIVLRLVNVCQLLSIFPVLAYIVRIQLFSTFFGKEYPGKKHVLCYSCLLCISCLCILYLCANYLSKLMSFVGAAVGLFLIYLIPLGVNAIYYKRKHPDDLEERQKEIMERSKQNLIPEENEEEKDIDDYGISEKPKNNLKDALFYLSQVLLVCFGVLTLVMQFVDINFFGIEIVEKK